MQVHLQKLNSAEDRESAHVAVGTGLRMARQRSLYERRFKRLLDLVGACVIILATLPVAFAIAIAVRVGLGRQVLYSQHRIGMNGEEFVIWKFRTMRPDRRRTPALVPQEQDRRMDHKVLDDPRHTGLGRMLRKLSLDELPQLINVLRGEMSLVGPRPEVASVARERGYVDHVRHSVRPGMTGPYQVSELRLNGDLRDGLALDAEYVADLGFATDARLLLATVRLLLTGSSGS